MPRFDEDGSPLPCAYKDCSKDVASKMLCIKHYTAWRKGNLEYTPAPKPPVNCAVINCPGAVPWGRYCTLHYSRKRRGTEMLNPSTPKAFGVTVYGEFFSDKCALDLCDLPTSFRYSLCKRHRERALFYGLTDLQMAELFKRDSACYCCGSTEKLSIDHDHNCCDSNRSCGKCVIGLLCHKCNRAFGMLGDDLNNLQRIIDRRKAGGMFA
jgi:hypothetical protein